MSLTDWIQIEDPSGEGGALVTVDFWLRCLDRGLLPGWRVVSRHSTPVPAEASPRRAHVRTSITVA